MANWMKNKRVLAAIGGIIIIIIAAAVSYQLYHNRTVSVLGKQTVKFSGYNGHGDATQGGAGKTSAAKAIAGALARKTGMNKDQTAVFQEAYVAAIENRNYDQDKLKPDFYGEKEEAKLVKALSLASNIGMWIEPQSGLKNGQKVKLIVKVKGDEKKVGVKNQKQTFTVSGLKAMQKVTIVDIQKQIKIKALGFDGAGGIIIQGPKGSSVEVPQNGRLKNGQSIKINVEPTDFLKKGQYYSGPKSFNYHVNGLKAVKVDNLEAVKAKNLALAKESANQFSADASSFEIVDTYLVTETAYQLNGGYVTFGQQIWYSTPKQFNKLAKSIESEGYPIASVCHYLFPGGLGEEDVVGYYYLINDGAVNVDKPTDTFTADDEMDLKQGYDERYLIKLDN